VPSIRRLYEIAALILDLPEFFAKVLDG